MLTIDLHGYTLEKVQSELETKLQNGLDHGETMVRIIHGQGKHSDYFPVIKSYIRRWAKDSAFSKEKIAMVFRGEDGSPYTKPNPGETILIFKTAILTTQPERSWEEEEDEEARRNVRRLRISKSRKGRRQR